MQKRSCLALTTLLAIAIPNPGLSHVPPRSIGNFTRLDAEPNLKIKAALLKELECSELTLHQLNSSGLTLMALETGFFRESVGPGEVFS